MTASVAHLQPYKDAARKLNDGELVEPASVKPVNVHVGIDFDRFRFFIGRVTGRDSLLRSKLSWNLHNGYSEQLNLLPSDIQ
jgi:hypothetical protein